MFQNGHTHNNNSAAFAAELLLGVWSFWDNGHERVKIVSLPLCISTFVSNFLSLNLDSFYEDTYEDT